MPSKPIPTSQKLLTALPWAGAAALITALVVGALALVVLTSLLSTGTHEGHQIIRLLGLPIVQIDADQHGFAITYQPGFAVLILLSTALTFVAALRRHR